MNDYESYLYARQRLALAQLMGDTDEVKIWQQHVAYWKHRLTPLALDAAGRGNDGDQKRAAAQVKLVR